MNIKGFEEHEKLIEEAYREWKDRTPKLPGDNFYARYEPKAGCYVFSIEHWVKADYDPKKKQTKIIPNEYPVSADVRAKCR